MYSENQIIPILFSFHFIEARSKSAILDVGESATFEVTFKALVAQRFEGQVRLTVVDNQYEDIVVQLVAEGYSDEIVIDCGNSITEVDSFEDGNLAEDDAPGNLHICSCCIRTFFKSEKQNEMEMEMYNDINLL